MEQARRRGLQGKIVSDKMDKTVVIEITRMKMHAKYKKFYKHSQKFKAHNPENKYKTGNIVVIEESRPLSKTKRWMVLGLINEIK